MSSLPAIEVAGRADRVRSRLTDVDALVVSSLTNVRWLTGFTGSNGWVVLSPDEIVIVTDGRYGNQAQQQMAAAGVDGRVVVGFSATEIDAALAAAVVDRERIGFEGEHTTVAHHRLLDAVIVGNLVATSGLVEAERRTKDDGELSRIQRACELADAALAEVAPTLGAGCTEAEVRNRLEQRMRELGAEGPSYETIVAAGPSHAAMPHHRPTQRVLETGDTVVIDVGALYDGYHSDMTRSFVVGTPDRLQAELYEVVLAAQVAGVAAVRPGLATSELDAVCRDSITDAGYGEWIRHGTGHGVGLLIHEDPFVGRSSTLTLQVGDVVTVEPGLYREGVGGFRVEDLVVVTEHGCRTLTSSPKDSPCLPSPPTT